MYCILLLLWENILNSNFLLGHFWSSAFLWNYGKEHGISAADRIEIMCIFKALLYSEVEERLSINIESIQVKCYCPGIYIIYVINPNLYYWKIIYILTRACKGLYMEVHKQFQKCSKFYRLYNNLYHILYHISSTCNVIFWSKSEKYIYIFRKNLILQGSLLCHHTIGSIDFYYS